MVYLVLGGNESGDTSPGDLQSTSRMLLAWEGQGQVLELR